MRVGAEVVGQDPVQLILGTSVGLLGDIPLQVLATSLHVVLVVKGIEEVQSLSGLHSSDAWLALLLHERLHVLLDGRVRVLCIEGLRLLKRAFRLRSPRRRLTRPVRKGLCNLRLSLAFGCLRIFTRKPRGNVLAIVHTLPVGWSINHRLDIGGVVAPRFRVVVLPVDAQVLSVTALAICAEVQCAAIFCLGILHAVKQHRSVCITIPVEFRFGCRHGVWSATGQAQSHI
mmetsp:Transcript_1332/g.3125  ORF Transcript_1332/g.3125 Transcript_1332/m.3125 type:complete len:230 (-) Transcript_1332:13-702(-)